MKYLSVCSGIEAATCAWHPLGWQPFAFSEIEAFPSAVLAHHYPSVPNLGDMTKFKEWPHAAIDLLVGGTPCQSFSVAGLRKGLADPRGNLMLTYLAIADRYRPRWLVWENVPGVLSSNGGRDFGALLGGLAKLGYGFAYRVLDAQYFGVPQRRRRVFVVGCLGDWRRAAAVLFERQSLQGHSAPSRKAGKGSAGSLAASTGGCDENDARDGRLVHCMSTGQAGAEIGIGIGTTLNCNHEAPIVTHSLRGEGFDASEDGTGRGTPLVPIAFQNRGSNVDANGEIASTLRSMGHAGSHQNGGGHQAVAYDTCYNEGITQGGYHASTQETYPGALLRVLRGEVGEEAFAQWGLGILDSLQSPEVLRQALHGLSVRPATFSRRWVVCCALGFQGYGSGWLLQSLREAGCARCSSQGWEPPEQLARELGAYLSELSQPGAQASRFMLDLWQASEGSRILREALSAVQEVGRPPRGKAQSAPTSMQVRRLTVAECEFLQGFPRGYTAIQVRGKPAADGPRYKALGNSMAVPVMAWIGRRIAEVDAIAGSERTAA